MSDIKTALAFVFLLLAAQPAFAAYGLPVPQFGLLEQPGALACFVNNQHVGATDASNPCGTPDRPRSSVPTVLSAGLVVSVSGGPYPTSATMTWTANGTMAAPVFIVGNGTPVFTGNRIGHKVRMAGQFMIVLGVKFDGAQLEVTGTAMAARDCEVTGNTSVGGVVIFGAGTVITRCHVHHNGDSESAIERDYHGVYPAPGSIWTWILDNHIHHNGGDGIQVGHAAPDAEWPRYVFIGGNQIHDDRENAIDIKKARDVIVAGNQAYGYWPTPSSEGAAFVVHDDPERVWFMNNAAAGSAYGLVSTGAVGFVAIGNIFRGSRSASPVFNAYGPSAIHARNTRDMYLGYNSLPNWDLGVSVPTAVGTNQLVEGNLIDAAFPIRVASAVVQQRNLTSAPTQPGGPAPASWDIYAGLYGVPILTDIYGTTRAGIFTIGAAQAPPPPAAVRLLP